MIDRSRTRDTPFPAVAFVGRVPVWNTRRGAHLGQRSYGSATTGRTYARKRYDQNNARHLARREPSTSGRRASHSASRCTFEAICPERASQTLEGSPAKPHHAATLCRPRRRHCSRQTTNDSLDVQKGVAFYSAIRRRPLSGASVLADWFSSVHATFVSSHLLDSIHPS